LSVSGKIDWHALDSATCVKPALFGLLCAWREVLILCQYTFWHTRWDLLLIKMPDIQDVMDVTFEDLSTEQQLQLKEAIKQFQQKCLMSFSKNRSGVPFLKSGMPRVLMPEEPDTTAAAEKQEVFGMVQKTLEDIMARHNTAFLNSF
jgi:hypothetical protein